MASVDRVKGGYRARWRTPDGKSRSKTFDRKLDAERHITAMEHARLRGDYVDPSAGRQTFLAFADEWALAQDWKGTTRDAWSPIRRRLEPLLGGLPLASIDRLALQTTQTTLAKRYARSTTTTTMAYAGMILRAAHVNGRIGRDPTRGLRAPKARADERDGKVGPDDVPTREEALAILAGAPASYRAAIALGIAGLRVGEVLGMAPDRLELDKRLVTVDQQMQRIGKHLVLTTPKAEKTRTITVPGVVAVELRRHLRDHQGDGLLFTGGRWTPDKARRADCADVEGDVCHLALRRDQFYASAWKPALEAAELVDRFTFHALRHFCASTLLAEGAPLTAVAGHLGDTVETVSRVYVHWLRDDRDVPAEVLDRVLAPTARVAVVSHDG